VSAALTPRDLTVPDEGSRTARDVLSRALGRLPRDLAAVPASLPATPEGRADLLAVQRLAEEMSDRGRAGALLACMLSPTVSAPLRALRNELAKASPHRAHADAILVELAATLAFDLALAGAIGGELHLARLPRRLLSLAARAEIELPEGARGATFADGRVVIERGDDRIDLDPASIARAPNAPCPLPVRRPYHPIDRAIVLAAADNNPRAAFGAEPGEPGNPVDLGGHDPAAWAGALAPALAVVEEALPDLRAEIDLYIRQIVPVGHHPETHRSASYREAVGSIYMTLHPGVMTLAEALIHEHSHNKLHALFEVDPVIENTHDKSFRSPLRQDLRPLRGVLLAVHAFLPVARMYERLAAQGHPLARGRDFPARFAQIRRINRDGAAVLLAHARPTPAGRALLAEIRRWIDHFGEP
jgi:HEXXH motif-containing protein